MARPIGMSKERKRREELESQKGLILAALEANVTTLKDIKELTGISKLRITQIFEEDKELNAKYMVARKMMLNTAVDNIQDIVNNPKHPQCFQASKYLVNEYKSDLDVIYEKKDVEDFSANISMENEGTPIVIKFGKQEQNEE